MITEAARLLYQKLRRLAADLPEPEQAMYLFRSATRTPKKISSRIHVTQAISYSCSRLGGGP